jgi:uncharacterized protein
MKESTFKKIQIEDSDFIILKEILLKYPYKFYAYGSRVNGNSKRYSDLDIYCKEKMKEIIELKMDLEDSNITIKVDVLDVDSCTSEFREIIKEELVEIK